MTVIRPKESKLERFERMEASRLAGRPQPVYCGTGSDSWMVPRLVVRPGGCGYRLTTRPSGLCRTCDRG